VIDVADEIEKPRPAMSAGYERRKAMWAAWRKKYNLPDPPPRRPFDAERQERMLKELARAMLPPLGGPDERMRRIHGIAGGEVVTVTTPKKKVQPSSEKERTTRTYTLSEAAKELRKSRRWLQDWLRDHPVDRYGVPFYSPLGRAKMFSDSDLTRILETTREEERCRLNSSNRRKKGARRTSASGARTSESMSTEALRLANAGKPTKSSKDGKTRSNVVSMERRR